MKRISILLALIILGVRTFSQNNLDTSEQSTIQNKKDFIELVGKVQNDKSLMGTFMYKGSQVNIAESEELKTAIGEFIEINWNNYKA